MQEVKFTSEEYPLNLLEDIIGGEWQHDCPADFEQSLEYVLAGLKVKEYTVIRMYYREGRKQKEIAGALDLSSSRIGQIRYKALRKLRHISRLNYLIYGVKGMEQRAVLKALNAEYSAAAANIADIAKKLTVLTKRTILNGIEESYGNVDTAAPIDALDLSVRAYNCLCRAGINTIGDLLHTKPEQLYVTRNLGKKSFDEVCEKLAKLGIDYKLPDETLVRSQTVFE